MIETRVCPMCGTAVDGRTSAACPACPAGPQCGLTCCPSCGYTWVEPEQSAVGRTLQRLFRRQKASGGPPPSTLADVPAGWNARLRGWARTPARRRQQLLAYGLAERGWVRVLRHSPTTIICVGQTEIALERELAATILIDGAHPAATRTDRPAVGS